MAHQVEVTREMFFDEVARYINDEYSLAMISKAYEFAQDKHKDQKRKSGEPYFVHIINVAYTLAKIGGGPQTICAGLLHDTVEDCGVTHEELTNLFDEDIATLVDGVTKISNIVFVDEKEYLAANHRKILIAMAKDIRVILIKLADRLHNMRTLNFMKPEKQQKIAKETLEVYAPIAHRLGLAEIKNELEDICFLYLNPEKYHEIAHLVETKKSERQAIVDGMIIKLDAMLVNHNFNFRIFGRCKHLYSIYNKMVTKNKSFDQILDLYAIRIVTETELNCYEILGYIHANYRPVSGRLKDYIAAPKSNMYQSLHTTILDESGNIFEIQIRTEEMDQIAEMGVAAHWSYKEGRNYSSVSEQKEIENKLTWFHDLIKMMDETAIEHPSEFMNQIQKDIFEANVYVMTPKGRVIELANGATPLDFAYRIHTEIGHQTVGATVNGALVPLNTPLKTGDVVAIRTSNQSAGPSEDWLKIVKTATARNKIKAFLLKKETEDRQEYILKGEKLLFDELKKRGLDPKIYLDKSHMDGIFSALSVPDYNGLCYALGLKSISTSQVAERLTTFKTTNTTSLDNESLTKLIQTRNEKSKKSVSEAGVVVEGIDSMLVTVAGCCMPVYGDDIVGFVSKGMGVKVHRADCPNIQDEKARLIDVCWEDDPGDKQYECWLRIDATDRNYLISDLVTTLSLYKVSLTGINSEVLPDKINAIIDVKIKVRNLDQLNTLIANIKKVNSVVNVTRTIK